jgi:hypothetical protein
MGGQQSRKPAQTHGVGKEEQRGMVVVEGWEGCSAEHWHDIGWHMHRSNSGLMHQEYW